MSSDEVDLNPSSSVLPRSGGSGLLPHKRSTATASYQYQTGCPLDCRQDEKQAVLLLARSSSTPFLLPSLPSFPPSTSPSTPLLLILTLPPQPQSKLGLTFSSSQPGPQRVDLCLSRVLTQRSQEISKLILSDRASSLLVEQRESLFGRILSYKPRVREKRREDVSGRWGKKWTEEEEEEKGEEDTNWEPLVRRKREMEERRWRSVCAGVVSLVKR